MNSGRERRSDEPMIGGTRGKRAVCGTFLIWFGVVMVVHKEEYI